MKEFEDFLGRMDNPEQRARAEEVLNWVAAKFPNLKAKIAWNQPMFTDHETFIIGFSVAKQHMAIAPEKAGILQFSDEIVEAGYDHTKELIRIKWSQPVDFSLLERVIAFNITDKADCSTFWRK